MFFYTKNIGILLAMLCCCSVSDVIKKWFCSCGQFKICYLPSKEGQCKSKEYGNVELYKEFNYLNDVEYDKTVAFVPPITCGKVIKVYDGDTITVASKLPHMDEPIYRFSVRLAGIDTPEIKGKTIHEKELAVAARDALNNLIFGKIVYFKNVSTEKYGRILADVYFENIHINSWMLEQNYAVPYFGGTKKNFV
jgi:endonuclease YncB( thermonuclease family)